MADQAIQIRNRFGTVELVPVTDYLPVKEITYNHHAAKNNDFDLETAEKIALITSKERVQIAFPFPLNGRAYLVLHNSPSTAAICRVSVVNFECEIAPRDMIEQLNRCAGYYHL